MEQKDQTQIRPDFDIPSQELIALKRKIAMLSHLATEHSLKCINNAVFASLAFDCVEKINEFFNVYSGPYEAWYQANVAAPDKGDA